MRVTMLGIWNRSYAILFITKLLYSIYVDVIIATDRERNCLQLPPPSVKIVATLLVLLLTFTRFYRARNLSKCVDRSIGFACQPSARDAALRRHWVVSDYDGAVLEEGLDRFWCWGLRLLWLHRGLKFEVRVPVVFLRHVGQRLHLWACVCRPVVGARCVVLLQLGKDDLPMFLENTYFGRGWILLFAGILTDLVHERLILFRYRKRVQCL